MSSLRTVAGVRTNSIAVKDGTRYYSDKNDYVDSSCEKDEGTWVYDATSSASACPVPVPPSGGPAILLPAAALLLGSGILTYAILRRKLG